MGCRRGARPLRCAYNVQPGERARSLQLGQGAQFHAEPRLSIHQRCHLVSILPSSPVSLLHLITEVHSQHFTKVILKDFKGRHKNGAEPATAAKSTSRKSATLSTRKRSSKKVANEDEDDDVVEEQSPSKKTKKVKEQEPTTVKLEDVVRTRERRLVNTVLIHIGPC